MRVWALAPGVSVTAGSHAFDAREPGGRSFVAFVVAPSGDHFELRVLDAPDLPAVLE